MGSFWKQLWIRIVRWLKAAFSEKKAKPQSEYPVYKDIPDPNMIFDSVLGIDTISHNEDVSKNLKAILRDIEKMGSRFRKLGEVDGPYQQMQKTVLELIDNVAERTKLYIKTIFLGLKKGLEPEVDINEGALEKAKKDLDSHERYMDQMTQELRWRPEDYSNWAWLFFIAGLLLLAADAALALNVTKEVFRLEGWSKWPMTLGITVCAIYMKVYFDEYILPGLERSITIFKPENLPGIYSSEHTFWLQGVWTFRFMVKTVLFGSTLLAFWWLADLRFEYLKTVVMGWTFLEKMDESGQGWVKTTFQLFSLLFPVIGAVCMALAIKKFRLLSLWKETKRHHKRLADRLQKAQEEYGQSKQDLENCRSYIEWCDGENHDFLKELKRFFYSCYVHGYDYGLQKKNAKLDILDKAKEIRRLYQPEHFDYEFK
ncbi:MAG: hypothetical protein AAF717_17415 [Bacteroidota bacterium]